MMSSGGVQELSDKIAVTDIYKAGLKQLSKDSLHALASTQVVQELKSVPLAFHHTVGNDGECRRVAGRQCSMERCCTQKYLQQEREILTEISGKKRGGK